MESNSTITQSLRINAPAAKVWAMFTDPSVTRQMGGEYVSEWKQGSSLRWKGINGQLLTNGRILNIEQNSFLQHSLFYPDTDDSSMAVISYRLHEVEGQTTVSIQEDFSDDLSANDRTAAEQGWAAALAIVKQLLEK